MPEQILIVDDEAEIADLIELYLKNENYAVHKFYTAREALACVETEQLDRQGWGNGQDHGALRDSVESKD